MAKDDYDVIVFKILTYLYAVLKRKIRFDNDTFEELLEKRDIQQEYFVDILRMMMQEELIEGVMLKKAWGNEYILISDLQDMQITVKGIQYLKENSRMTKIFEVFNNAPSMIGSLVSLIGPFKPT